MPARPRIVVLIAILALAVPPAAQAQSGGGGAGDSQYQDPFGSQSQQTATQAFAIPISQATSIASQIEAGKASSTVHIGATAKLGVYVDGSRSSADWQCDGRDSLPMSSRREWP